MTSIDAISLTITATLPFLNTIPAADDPRLPAGTPHVLQEPIALGKAVEAVVTLAAGTDKAAERVHLVLAGVAAVLVDLADAELNRGVVLGLDDAVRGAALARHVAVREKKLMLETGDFRETFCLARGLRLERVGFRNVGGI